MFGCACKLGQSHFLRGQRRGIEGDLLQADHAPDQHPLRCWQADQRGPQADQEGDEGHKGHKGDEGHKGKGKRKAEEVKDDKGKVKIIKNKGIEDLACLWYHDA